MLENRLVITILNVPLKLIFGQKSVSDFAKLAIHELAQIWLYLTFAITEYYLNTAYNHCHDHACMNDDQTLGP